MKQLKRISNIFNKIKMYFLLRKKTKLRGILSFQWDRYAEEIRKAKLPDETLIQLKQKIQTEIDKIKIKTIKKLLKDDRMGFESVQDIDGNQKKEKKIQDFFDIDLTGTELIVAEAQLSLGELAPSREIISDFVEEIRKLNLIRFKSDLTWEFLDELTEEDALFASNNGRTDIKKLYDEM